jgi:CRISPR-associated RAMP protein (TIGR02581 family)
MNEIRIINARLVLNTALHIGSGKNQFPADSLFRRSGDGKLVIPGRAVGGCLRAAATRLAPHLDRENGKCRVIQNEQTRTQEPLSQRKSACGCFTCQLFGDRYPDEEQHEAAASRLWIYDAFQANRIQTYVRDGVGISRTNQAAARNVKFDYEIIPAGTVFNFALLWEPGDKYLDEQSILLAAVLQEWVEGRGQLGSSAARGLGQFHLEGLHCDRIDLQTPEQLIDYLSCGDHNSLHGSLDDWFETALTAAVQRVKTVKRVALQTNAMAGRFVRIDFDLLFQGQFLTNDPLAASATGFDHAPLSEVFWDSNNRQGRPIISGSSLRGAIRARAERIARTLADLRHPGGMTFLVCDPLVRDISQPNVSCATRLEAQKHGQDGEVDEKDLCLACRLFGSSQLGSRLWIRDAAWQGNDVNWNLRDFLAIDRFTGGGQDGAKFDAAGLVQPCFQSSLVLHSPESWELGWLALVLRDLADGFIPLGFGSAKGFGAVKMDHVKWEIGWINEENSLVKKAHPLPPKDTRQSGVYTVFSADVSPTGWKPESLADLLDDWVKDFQTKVAETDTTRDIPSEQEDSFATSVNSLYGLPWRLKGAQK